MPKKRNDALKCVLRRDDACAAQVERAQEETDRIKRGADDRHATWRDDAETKLASLREEVEMYRTRMADKEVDTRKAVDAARSEMERYLVRHSKEQLGCRAQPGASPAAARQLHILTTAPVS